MRTRVNSSLHSNFSGAKEPERPPDFTSMYIKMYVYIYICLYNNQVDGSCTLLLSPEGWHKLLAHPLAIVETGGVINLAWPCSFFMAFEIVFMCPFCKSSTRNSKLSLCKGNINSKVSKSNRSSRKTSVFAKANDWGIRTVTSPL